MRYLPYSSLTPTNIGSPLHLIRTSVSLWTVTPSLVNMDMVPSSEVLPTLMREVGKLLKVSAWVALLDNFLIGSFVTNWALLVLPLATPTRLVDHRSIGKPAFARSCSLI